MHLDRNISNKIEWLFTDPNKKKNTILHIFQECHKKNFYFVKNISPFLSFGSSQILAKLYLFESKLIIFHFIGIINLLRVELISLDTEL